MTVWNFGSHYNFRPQKRACLTQALFIGVTPHKLHIHSRTTPFKNCILYLQQEKPRHDRRGDFMKYQKKMIVPALALAMLLCGTMTAFAANANPTNAENLREEGESAIVFLKSYFSEELPTRELSRGDTIKRLSPLTIFLDTCPPFLIKSSVLANVSLQA